MLERALENWLTSTNERNYQVPFCQALTGLGYDVIHVSSHGQLEQGKDVIAINPDGSYVAYQLKTGNIDLGQWRNIKGEIHDLIELPIVHPSINPISTHAACLVTNGRVTDPVRQQIVQINEDNQKKGRNYAYLSIIQREELLRMLLAAQENIVPLELEDFDAFLKFYLSDGTEFFDKNLFAQFLFRTFHEKQFQKVSDRANAFAGSVVLTASLLDKFQRRKNYYSEFEAWVTLRAFLKWLGQRWSISTRLVERTLRLLDLQIIRQLTDLKEEILSRSDFFEGDILGDGGPVYAARKMLVLGAISALELHRLRAEKGYCIDLRVVEMIRKSLPIELICESMVPHLLSLMWLLEKVADTEIAPSIPRFILTEILTQNHPDQDMGLPDPYYSPEDVLLAAYSGDCEKVNFRGFSGSSYVLESMIHVLVRRNQRDVLEKAWRRLSHIHLQTFVPDHIEDFWLWRAEKGVDRTDFLHAPESWARLKDEAHNIKDVPPGLRDEAAFLYLFLLVFPHRLSTYSIKAIDIP